ncbi:HigA family addiction module antitoxin [Actinopolymorpha sp. B17G11]|uniref:HigA family addiction module antitoxin n=1 Tax=unclassified Actinopolymorpha TaxID=2627063 RepID=UPI0032D990E8
MDGVGRCIRSYLARRRDIGFGVRTRCRGLCVASRRHGFAGGVPSHVTAHDLNPVHGENASQEHEGEHQPSRLARTLYRALSWRAHRRRGSRPGHRHATTLRSQYSPGMYANQKRSSPRHIKRTPEKVNGPAVHAHVPVSLIASFFRNALGISQYRLAQAIGVSPRRINEIVHGKRRISPETAVRMSKALGLSERYWLNVQADYDIEIEKDRHRAEIDAITPLTA